MLNGEGAVEEAFDAVFTTYYERQEDVTRLEVFDTRQCGKGLGRVAEAEEHLFRGKNGMDVMDQSAPQKKDGLSGRRVVIVLK